MFALALVLAATTPAEHIALGERALDSLDYDVAAEELAIAATDPSATDSEMLRANFLAGIANRVRGKDFEARMNFRYVLLRQPGWALPADAPPKVRLFFETVRAELTAEQASNPGAVAPATPATSTRASSSAPLWPWLVGGGAGVAALSAIGLGAVQATLEYTPIERDVRNGIRVTGAGLIGTTAVGVVVVGVGGALALMDGP